MIPDAVQRRLEMAIPAGERILLDTTCLAAYLDSMEPVHPVARHILDAFVASGRNHAIVAMVTMMEILVRPLRSEPPVHRTVLLVHPAPSQPVLDRHRQAGGHTCAARGRVRRPRRAGQAS